MNRIFLFMILSLVAFPSYLLAADSKVKVYNDTNWSIDHFYLSEANDRSWGPDQLGEDLIQPGESFELTGIPDDVYDLKLVDEEGDECIVGGIEIASSAKVHINNEDLIDCQSDTEDFGELQD